MRALDRLIGSGGASDAERMRGAMRVILSTLRYHRTLALWELGGEPFCGMSALGPPSVALTPFAMPHSWLRPCVVCSAGGSKLPGGGHSLLRAELRRARWPSTCQDEARALARQRGDPRRHLRREPSTGSARRTGRQGRSLGRARFEACCHRQLQANKRHRSETRLAPNWADIAPRVRFHTLSKSDRAFRSRRRIRANLVGSGITCPMVTLVGVLGPMIAFHSRLGFGRRCSHATRCRLTCDRYPPNSGRVRATRSLLNLARSPAESGPCCPLLVEFGPIPGRVLCEFSLRCRAFLQHMVRHWSNLLPHGQVLAGFVSETVGVGSVGQLSGQFRVDVSRTSRDVTRSGALRDLTNSGRNRPVLGVRQMPSSGRLVAVETQLTNIAHICRTPLTWHGNDHNHQRPVTL